ncbi:hypothetical protein CLAFUW4_01228 [Fulvia fulva]|uniref:Uncharacterized protein n=1 Tax=Passalora fulva TaxID=5499 RepID=A0A9Q8L6I2_PASFU|nr:uncharacterized protein CLAFUR5_01233 [Fulvia fulva]KAK4634314.1 hypothetical protein CLAFUR4_01229 [Fulvia fulva]KAK4638440.1 hypothetical protein CLAFUR0_01230 [Fulvia fulva]UJO11634.1 hypothetical protein CLAFUR5_01233 [Fulvia fulva]WPV09743.1 hypothetical protein CLAFUW4_01228 [Fulvia fulva]WPV24767.1 hypothetical protein CLAFUW7_01233 [Fulvia fulva]
MLRAQVDALNSKNEALHNGEATSSLEDAVLGEDEIDGADAHERVRAVDRGALTDAAEEDETYGERLRDGTGILTLLDAEPIDLTNSGEDTAGLLTSERGWA